MLVLKNARMIDGKSDAALEGMTIIVEGEKIKAVGKGLSWPEAAVVIDAAGKTVLPGLIDVHVHMGESADFPGFGGRERSKNYAEVRDWTLKHGVTSVRTCGDYMPDAFNLRKEIEDGVTRGPRIFACGPSFQARNGHPSTTVWQSDPEVLEHAAAFADTPEEAYGKVKEIAAAGADFIKIIIGDVDVWHYPARLPRLKAEVIQAIIDEAHNQGLPVSSHCESTLDALAAVKMGVDGVEHLVQLGSTPYDLVDGLFETMVKNNVPLTLTSYLIKVYDSYAPVEEAKLFEYARDYFERAYRGGVDICAGTDSGAPKIYHGLALLNELETMVDDIGMKPVDAILAATRNNSKLLRCDDIGCIEEGKLADLVVVDGKPDADIHDVKKTALVIKNGKIVTDNMLAL